MLGWTLGGQRMQQERRASALSGAGFGSCPQCLKVVYLVSGELTAAVVVHTWAAILEPGNEIPITT